MAKLKWCSLNFAFTVGHMGPSLIEYRHVTWHLCFQLYEMIEVTFKEFKDYLFETISAGNRK